MDSYNQYMWEYEWFVLEQEDKQLANDFAENILMYFAKARRNGPPLTEAEAKAAVCSDILLALRVFNQSVGIMQRVLHLEERRARRITMDLMCASLDLAAAQSN